MSQASVIRWQLNWLSWEIQDGLIHLSGRWCPCWLGYLGSHYLDFIQISCCLSAGPSRPFFPSMILQPLFLRVLEIYFNISSPILMQRVWTSHAFFSVPLSPYAWSMCFLSFIIIIYYYCHLFLFFVLPLGPVCISSLCLFILYSESTKQKNMANFP